MGARGGAMGGGTGVSGHRPALAGDPDGDDGSRPCRPRPDRRRSWTPIPTEYKNVWMRTGLEARCAATLDRYGLGWTYEPDTFGMADGRQYTPDFRVYGCSIWYVEVKPDSCPSDEIRKARQRLLSILSKEPAARLCLWLPERGLMRIYVPSRPEQRRWKHLRDQQALEAEGRMVARQKIDHALVMFGAARS
jgi:hypothetical protein